MQIDIEKLDALAVKAKSQTEVAKHDKLTDLFQRELANAWPAIKKELEAGREFISRVKRARFTAESPTLGYKDIADAFAAYEEATK